MSVGQYRLYSVVSSSSSSPRFTLHVKSALAPLRRRYALPLVKQRKKCILSEGASCLCFLTPFYLTTSFISALNSQVMTGIWTLLAVTKDELPAKVGTIGLDD